MAVFFSVGGMMGGAMEPGLPRNDARLTAEVRAVHQVLPSVINIATEKLVSVSDRFETFFNEYFETPVRYYRKSIPLGSGVIVDHRGLVLTNLHVVRRASSIEIHFLDGTNVSARLAAYNERNDLALLKIEENSRNMSFSEIDFAVPDDLLLGETVIAVGNPFGLEHTVTSGVLSARNRSLSEGEVVFSDIIQTDAAINPGNSGGPLINLNGELIGLNLAIRAGAEGIGFAIPLQRIEEVLASWLLPSHFSSGICGFIPATQVVGGKVQAVVSEIEADGPAAKAGLAANDVMVKINGTAVHRSLDVSRALWPLKPGDTCRLELADGRVVTVPIVVMNDRQLIRLRVGLQVQKLTTALKQALNMPQVDGLVISDIDSDGALGQSDIQRGDLLFGIGHARLDTPEELAKLLRNLNAGEAIDLHFLTRRQLYNEVLLQRRTVRIKLQ